MVDWHLGDADLKHYPHLDPAITAADAMAYAQDEIRVKAHAFFPFISYSQRWTKFAPKGVRGTVKERPIRYAARRDAYIYSYYRHLLSGPYEAALIAAKLENSILAYRRIRDTQGRGKCNINFAQDAFSCVKTLKNCAVVALDISSFFESIDHERLKLLWARMLDVSRLPDDHFNVYKNITRYSFVDKKALFERLGHFGDKRKTQSGKTIKGYLTPHRRIPQHLCMGHEFRNITSRLAGGDRIIETNYKRYGIPQGAPISDLLANLYLIDFDIEMREAVSAVGGYYFRYSDDILLIVPGGETEGRNWMQHARSAIACHGSKIQIKEEKAAIWLFNQATPGLSFRRIHGSQGADGMEYLGFRFDGRRVYLRNSTISNLYRKISRAAARDANALARRYPDKNEAFLRSKFDYERLISRFGRVEDFNEKAADFRSWTFWTYANRAAVQFDSEGVSISRQMRQHRQHIRARVDLEISRAIVARGKRQTAAAAAAPKIATSSGGTIGTPSA